MIACADFETTTDPKDCRVWAYSICEIGNTDNFLYGNSIDQFMDICKDKNVNHVFYFHNLKFDGEFIFYYLFRNGFKHVTDKKLIQDNTFMTLISDKGQFYQIEIYFEKKGKKVNKVTIKDSLKILNFSVDEIAKGFNLPIRKLDLDYEAYREPNHILTNEEIAYIRNDVEIVARALNILFKKGMDKMTIGADALHNYKKFMTKEEFNKYFPKLEYEHDKIIRQSYKGGFTYLNKKYKEKVVNGGIVLDVNSLYPSVMHDCPLPYGEGVYFKGKYKKDETYNLYFQIFTCDFELKKDHIPTVQIKKNLAFVPTEYLESSEGEYVTMCMTNVDFELFKDHYNIYNIKYEGGFKYKSTDKLFKSYIDHWINEKIKAKKEHNKPMYLLAKLMLNSLYGKFSVNPDIRSKYPVYDKENDLVRYKYSEYELREALYIPVGSFITSHARNKTIRSAQKVYDRFIYADTDSLHLEGFEEPEDLEIDDYKLGAWKKEFVFSKGKYLRQKSYMEYGKEPDEEEEYLKITCAGLPKNCYDQVNFDTFNLGSVFHGKLSPKHVSGGIVLDKIDFTIKK